MPASVHVSLVPRPGPVEGFQRFDDADEPAAAALCVDVADPKWPTPGSALHDSGKCEPCAWHHSAEGCRHGASCIFCHLCPEGEMKRRKKVKRELRRKSEAREQIAAATHADLSLAANALRWEQALGATEAQERTAQRRQELGAHTEKRKKRPAKKAAPVVAKPIFLAKELGWEKTPYFLPPFGAWFGPLGTSA